MSTETEGTVDAGESSMEATSTNQLMQSRALRWWPAALMLALMLALRLLPVLLESPPLPVMMLGFMGPAVVGLLLLPWWLFASRTSLREKLIGFIGLLVIAAVTFRFVDASMRGMPTIMYHLPLGLAAFAAPW